jgi:hypothetical protein
MKAKNAVTMPPVEAVVLEKDTKNRQRMAEISAIVDLWVANCPKEGTLYTECALQAIRDVLSK